jgi:hypothetical protein
VTVGRSDIAAGLRLAVALRSDVLLVAALLMTALLVATLAMAAGLMPALTAVALTAVALTTLALTTLALTTLALSALVALVLSRHAVHAWVGHALWVAAGIEGGRQALAHVLHVDVGDRQFTSAHAWPLAVIHGTQHAIIMVRVLQEVFGGDAVAGGTGIACQLQVLLKHLVGIAANAQLLPAAIVALALVMAATTHPVGLARAAAASASVIVILFHVNVTSSSTVIEIGSSSRMSASSRAFANIMKQALAASLALDAVNVRRHCLGLASLRDGRLSPGLGPWSVPTAGADPSRFRAAFQ